MNIRSLLAGGALLVLAALAHPRFSMGYLGRAMIDQPALFAGMSAAAYGLAVLGAVVCLRAVVRYRPAWLLLAAAAALVVAGLGYRASYDQGAMQALRRMTAWANGSTLYEYDEEFLDWARGYTASLEERPGKRAAAARAHVHLGDYLLRVGRHQESIRHFEKAREQLAGGEGHADLKGDVLRWLGIAHLRAGETEYCLPSDDPAICIYPLQGGGIWSNKVHPRQAIAYFEELLARRPGDYAGRWLYNYAHMANGTFPEGVQEVFRLPRKELGLDADVPRFVNLAQQAGVDVFGVSGGAIMDDFDGDGLLDLVASCCDRQTPLAYHHNEGNGRFEDWSERAGLHGQLGGLNIIHGDYDGDGDLDLYVLRGAWMGERGRDRNSLLRNEGAGRFTDVTDASGLGAEALPCLAGAFADYDNDGDLDLYVGNERLSPGKYAPSSLWRNEGDGSFTLVSEEAGVTNDRYTRGVCWGDYDNDGDEDLYVSNFNHPNRLYRNEGDGSFTDVAPELGVHSHGGTERSFPAWFVDVNNDGWLDIFSTSYPLGARGGEVREPASDRFGEPVEDAERCRLWINDGKGGFRDASREWGVHRIHAVMGANYADLDHDGWPDLYLATGAPSFEVVVPNVLYMNLGGERFVDATGASGLGHLAKGHGVAFGDVDNDGDVDLYNELGGWYTDSRFRNALFINGGDAEGPENAWLTLRLRGVQTNTFGVGARVKAVFEEGGATREVHAVCGPGASFGGNSLQVELGLGGAGVVDRLEIFWPVSGETQVFEDVAPNRVLRVTEGATDYEVVEGLPRFVIPR